jgi:GNAT superfamily N-acetyltransferase
MLKIVLAETDIQYQQVRELLSELSAWDTTQVSRLGLDAQAAMDFYYVSGEEMLPGVYAPPEGRLFFATCSAKAAGCGALRRMTADTCELKGINVRPEFRGKQIGRQLAETLILAAIEAGYSVSNPQPNSQTPCLVCFQAVVKFRRGSYLLYGIS